MGCHRKTFNVKVFGLGEHASTYGFSCGQFTTTDLSTSVLIRKFEGTNPKPGEYFLVGGEGLGTQQNISGVHVRVSPVPVPSIVVEEVKCC